MEKQYVIEKVKMMEEFKEIFNRRYIPSAYDNSMNIYQQLTNMSRYLREMHKTLDEAITYMEKRMDLQDRQIHDLHCAFIKLKNDVYEMHNKFVNEVRQDVKDMQKEIKDFIALMEERWSSFVEWAKAETEKVVREHLLEMMKEGRFNDVAVITIDYFPRLEGEDNDIPRINRGIQFLAKLGKKAELRFLGETYMVKPEKPAEGDTTVQANKKRIRLYDNVSLVGLRGVSVIKVTDNNPDYHALIEEEKPSAQPVRNVRIQDLIIDHNVENNKVRPDGSINNHREMIRIYQSRNLIITGCVVKCNSINTINMRMGVDVDEMTKGNYPNKGTKIIDNDFTFMAMDLPYFDNTYVTVWGDGVEILNNRISSKREKEDGEGGENTAIEVGGINVECRDNYVDNFMLGADVQSLDKYPKDRNIYVRRNQFLNCARGVKVWMGRDPLVIVSGVYINENYILMDNIRYKNRTEVSTRCGIGMSNHATDSVGQFINSSINGNTITMTKASRDYLLTLEYPGVYYPKTVFDGYYCGIYIGGKNNIPHDIDIKNNSFIDLPMPAMTFDHANVVNNINIFSNTMINCGYGGRSPVLCFKGQNQNFTIAENKFLDKGQPEMLGKILYEFSKGTFIDKGNFWEFNFANNTEHVKPKGKYYEYKFGEWLWMLNFDKLIYPGPPTTPPQRYGNFYVDRTNNASYISIGQTTTGDWKRIDNPPVTP